MIKRKGAGARSAAPTSVRGWIVAGVLVAVGVSLAVTRLSAQNAAPTSSAVDVAPPASAREGNAGAPKVKEVVESEVKVEGRPAPLITLELEPSRANLVAGDGIGMTGTVENVSKQVVYLNGNAFTLTLPLELEGSRSAVKGYAAYFPTEKYDKRAPNEAAYFDKTIALRPGDKYVAHWTPYRGNGADGLRYVLGQIVAQAQYLFFYPGEYRAVVAAKYWTDPHLPAGDYGTVTKSARLVVAAPFSVILLGAGVGGLIAYIIFPTRLPGRAKLLPQRYEPLSRHTVGILGAVLLSMMVTIVLSRIAETQFIISVTVRDVWGAIVIGFVAQYGGIKLLKKLMDKKDDPSDDHGGKASSAGKGGATGKAGG
jgi:hypothetical protein